jgi:hypothetical protein
VVTPHIKTAAKKGTDMEFLKAIFGDKALSFDDLAKAIEAHNGNEANKDSQIKIGNLGGGEYVGKLKYDNDVQQLKDLLSGKDTDIKTLQEAMESLKKGNVDADTIKQKLADVEKQLKESQAREAETKLKYAVRDALREAKVKDVEYMEYLITQKLKEEGKTLELDESEHIKGWDDILSGMKTQKPDQFEKAGKGIQIDPNPLPAGDGDKAEPTSLAEALRQQFEPTN